MLGKELDLLKNYPKSKRDTKGRANVITEADREIARQYGKDFLMVIVPMDTVVLATCLAFGNRLFLIFNLTFN
ncbi:hypothetical protein [Pseudoalteromonas sp. B160]|uniref:hypothetical protein n=1 Tax=Pseudoalteromonas sp. B160 TaxID=630414 RepID=UPI00301D3BDF